MAWEKEEEEENENENKNKMMMLQEGIGGSREGGKDGRIG